MTLARATWDGSALTNLRELFSSDVTTEASRIVFGRDGMIYMSLGRSQEGANAPAQDPNNYGGKLLRLRDDGTVPPDNPFVGRAGYKPEIFTMGHRNQLGLTVNPETGEIWASEQGPNGGDEINIIQAGKNYGWPVISYGRSYPGPRVSDKPWQEGMEQPCGRVGAVDCAVGNDLLHGGQVPWLEAQRVRRRAAPGREPSHGAYGTHRVQRQVGGGPPRADAAVSWAAYSRRAAGSRRIPVRADRGERRGVDQDRAGELRARADRMSGRSRRSSKKAAWRSLARLRLRPASMEEWVRLASHSVSLPRFAGRAVLTGET